MKQLVDIGVAFASSPTYKASALGFAGAIHTPWTEPPFKLLGRCPRKVLALDVVHDCVVQRCKNDPKYRPEALAAWAQKNMP